MSSEYPNKRSKKRSNKQQIMFNYFDKDTEYQSNSKKALDRSGSISNTQVNMNYRHNSTLRGDHRHSPPILLNFAQYTKETQCDSKIIRDNPFVDICPYKCERDNLYFDLWPVDNLLFCNQPFSGNNVKMWMEQLKKHVEINKGSAVLVAKIACSVSNYWFDFLYNNNKIDVTKYELRNNWHYTGFKVKPEDKIYKNAPFGSILVLMQPTPASKRSKLKILPKDLRAWKQSMPRNEYNSLEFRQKQHLEMNHEYFIIDDETPKQIKRNCKPETLTQMYSSNKNSNHNVKHDKQTDSDSDIQNTYENINDDISDENYDDSSNELIQENESGNHSEYCFKTKKKNKKKRKRNSDCCNGNSPKKRKLNHNTNIDVNVSSTSSSSEHDSCSGDTKNVDNESWDIDSCSSTDK